MSARFAAIESQIVAQLQALVTNGTLKQVKAVPADALFQGAPDLYPAALVTVQEARPKAPANKVSGRIQLSYTIPVWIGVYANSDGAEVGDARASAWPLVDAIIAAPADGGLTGFVPSMGQGDAPLPLAPTNIVPFTIEAGKYGIMIAMEMQLLFSV